MRKKRRINERKKKRKTMLEQRKEKEGKNESKYKQNR